MGQEPIQHYTHKTTYNYISSYTEHHYYLAEVLVTEQGWLANLYTKTKLHFWHHRFEVMTDQFIND